MPQTAMPLHGPISETAPRDGLADILGAEERVLWRGRPDTAAFVTKGQMVRFLRILVSIALFFYILNRLWLQVPPLWDVRMIVLFIFFQSVPTEILVSVLRRRRTEYALTTRHMIVMEDRRFWGRKVTLLPLTAQTPIELHLGANLSSILVQRPKRRFWLGPVPKVGFERIADAAGVFGLIGKVQREAA